MQIYSRIYMCSITLLLCGLIGCFQDCGNLWPFRNLAAVLRLAKSEKSLKHAEKPQSAAGCPSHRPASGSAYKWPNLRKNGLDIIAVVRNNISNLYRTSRAFSATDELFIPSLYTQIHVQYGATIGIEGSMLPICKKLERQGYKKWKSHTGNRPIHVSTFIYCTITPTVHIISLYFHFIVCCHVPDFKVGQKLSLVSL